MDDFVDDETGEISIEILVSIPSGNYVSRIFRRIQIQSYKVLLRTRTTQMSSTSSLFFYLGLQKSSVRHDYYPICFHIVSPITNNRVLHVRFDFRRHHMERHVFRMNEVTYQSFQLTEIQTFRYDDFTTNLIDYVMYVRPLLTAVNCNVKYYAIHKKFSDAA